MAELINLKNGKIDLKFHANVKNFKRVQKFNYKRNFFKLYIDKNDSVYNITKSEVVSWKEERGRKIPEETLDTRDQYFFNKFKGQPSKIVLTKIAAEIDMEELISE